MVHEPGDGDPPYSTRLGVICASFLGSSLVARGPRFKISMSLDGFVAGARQSADDLRGLELARGVAAPEVTHLELAKR
ncbi:uncharacterized protein SOCE26_004450 [Sorangium cellulosum]|uniref:Uncharacterized protein n=1 Tax=Sorangium cellulosum TaxID=56 RepID=A0A2L0EID7_SORCE|nr:hypothetical protein [Sorangium cellulosum]AUX39063.1 uncharacterized protein SOCE26_004450 [Sorangium cellulosum]